MEELKKQIIGYELGLVLNSGAPFSGIKRKHCIVSPESDPVNPANISAFTILELLVAMTLMSILLVLLLNMVDGATKLWRVNENRVDSYREARAALGVMTRDFQNATASPTNTGQFLLNAAAFTKLQNVGNLVTDTNQGAGIFLLAALPPKAQDGASNKSDVCQVGYFLAFGKSSSSSNSPVNTLNIYRYILSSDPTFARFTNSSQPLFPSDLTPLDPKVELLARNVTRFTVRAYTITNGIHVPFADSVGTPLPDLVEIGICAVNQEAAKKLPNIFLAWTDTNSAIYTNVIAPVEQTFTTRVKINRPQ